MAASASLAIWLDLSTDLTGEPIRIFFVAFSVRLPCDSRVGPLYEDISTTARRGSGSLEGHGHHRRCRGRSGTS
jgi:hypothetical protein